MAVPDLVISGLYFPPYSVRGVTQSLAPVDLATQVVRTINGALLDVSDPLFRKYQSQVACTDQQVPRFLFPGTTVTVECITELSYLTTNNNPERTPVTSSQRVDGLYTFYRPQLTMLITAFAISHDEWGRNIGWTLDLEEV